MLRSAAAHQKDTEEGEALPRVGCSLAASTNLLVSPDKKFSFFSITPWRKQAGQQINILTVPPGYYYEETFSTPNQPFPLKLPEHRSKHTSSVCLCWETDNKVKQQQIWKLVSKAGKQQIFLHAAHLQLWQSHSGLETGHHLLEVEGCQR